MSSDSWRLLTDTGSPHACREEHGKEDISPNSLIDRLDDCAEEFCLNKRADGAETQAECEEFLSLAETKYFRAKGSQGPVEKDIRP